MVRKSKVDDSVDGTEGDDALIGVTFWPAANAKHGLVFNGLGGNDAIYGTNGNDTLSGGNGNDYLSGKQGADMLNGGPGADVFAFQGHPSSSPAFGVDTVSDFVSGEDKFDFTKLFNVTAPTEGSIFYGIDYLTFGDLTITSDDPTHHHIDAPQTFADLVYGDQVYDFVIDVVGDTPIASDFLFG